MTNTTAPVATAPAAKTAKAKVACECSKYEILVNVHEIDGPGSGSDLDWDEEITTHCTSTTTRVFAPGHDAKLKGFLIRNGLLGHEITRRDEGMAVSGDAETFARRYDFGHMVLEGLRLGQEKAAAKAAKKAKKEADREFAEALREAKVTVIPAAPAETEDTPAEPVADEAAVLEALTVTAKIGRWEYKGQLSEAGFTYEDKKGNTQTVTTGYTVV